jgi:hypothetical protein
MERMASDRPHTLQQDLTQVVGRTVTTTPDPRAARFSPFPQYLDNRLQKLPNHGAASSDPKPAPR